MSRPITLYRVSLPSFSSLFQISWIFHAICLPVKNLNRFCMLLLLWIYCAAPPLKKKGERGKGNWDIFATRAHKPVCTGRSFYANLSVSSPFINQSSGIWMGVARLLLCNVSLHPLPRFEWIKGKRHGHMGIRSNKSSIVVDLISYTANWNKLIQSIGEKLWRRNKP